MARGYGRSLDLTTLMVLITNRLRTDEDMQRMMICFDKDLGFSAWFGPHEPDEPKHFETWDSALLALLIGNDSVPGVDGL